MAGIEHSVLIALLQSSLARGQTCYLTVSSDSMAPLLQAGDEVAVVARPPGRLRRGDIVVVDEESGLLTHRYWGKDGKGKLVTRGDRSLVFDPAWEPERLLGRVNARRRRGRTLSLERGTGAWLAAHLGRVAALEQRLFAGYAPPPLPAAPAPTRLGKRLRQNGRYLPGRMLRRALHTWRAAIALPFAGTAGAGGTIRQDDAG